MTVTYSRDVASSTFLCLYKLLLKWKGSVWKSIWLELLLWLIVYAILSVTYRNFLDEHQREIFEDVSIFCDTYANFIPITFMLGFYVTAIFGRWQKIFDNIGWIDTPGLTVAAHIEGTTEIARNIRRNVVRHMVLMQALVFRDISMRVRKRFPTLNHLVTAGFMTEEELRHYNKVESQHEKFWQPMQWIFSSTRMARQMGLIASDIAYTDLNLKISQFRANVQSLTFFDWVQIPLAYTQVVHLAVRSFFVLAVMGRQLLHPIRHIPGLNQPLDVYYPVMSTLQLTFLIGWMKVAEVMINPLGEDDDDFETNWVLDRNLQVGLSMADDQFDKYPPIERDAFWEDVNVEPYYTPEAAAIPRNPQIGSCANIMPHIENSFMLRLRKRTISDNTYGTENDDTDVVPVAGLEINRDLHRSSSPFVNTSRRLSALVRQMRAKGRGRLDNRRPTIVPSSNETEDTCEGRSSPEGSVDYGLDEVVTVPRNSEVKPKRRVRVLSVQELSEISEERNSERSSRAHLEHSQTDSAILEPTENEDPSPPPRAKRPRSQ